MCYKIQNQKWLDLCRQGNSEAQDKLDQAECYRQVCIAGVAGVVGLFVWGLIAFAIASSSPNRNQVSFFDYPEVTASCYVGITWFCICLIAVTPVYLCYSKPSLQEIADLQERLLKKRQRNSPIKLKGNSLKKWKLLLLQINLISS